MSQNAAVWWLIQLALGGGLVLLVARLVMPRMGAPASRGRLGEVGVLSALLLGALALGPRWLPVSLPAWAVPGSSMVQHADMTGPVERDVPAMVDEVLPDFDLALPPDDFHARAAAPA